jgi:hypothetical protein
MLNPTISPRPTLSLDSVPDVVDFEDIPAKRCLVEWAEKHAEAVRQWDKARRIALAYGAKESSDLQRVKDQSSRLRWPDTTGA